MGERVITLDEVKGKEWVKGEIVSIDEEGTCLIETERGNFYFPVNRILVGVMYCYPPSKGKIVLVEDYEEAAPIYPIYEGLEVYVEKGSEKCVIAHAVVEELIPDVSIVKKEKDFQVVRLKKFAEENLHLYKAYLKVKEKREELEAKINKYRTEWYKMLQKTIESISSVEVVERNDFSVTFQWGGKKGKYLIVNAWNVLFGKLAYGIDEGVMFLFVEGEDVLQAYRDALITKIGTIEKGMKFIMEEIVPEYERKLKLLDPLQYVEKKWNKLINRKFKLQSKSIRECAGLILLQEFEEIYKNQEEVVPF